MTTLGPMWARGIPHILELLQHKAWRPGGVETVHGVSNKRPLPRRQGRKESPPGHLARRRHLARVDASVNGPRSLSGPVKAGHTRSPPWRWAAGAVVPRLSRDRFPEPDPMSIRRSNAELAQAPRLRGGPGRDLRATRHHFLVESIYALHQQVGDI